MEQLRKTNNRTETLWFTSALRDGTPPEIRAAAIQKITSAVRIARGNRTTAARILGMSGPTLSRLVSKAPELANALDAAKAEWL